jgi:hypothetical protein
LPRLSNTTKIAANFEAMTDAEARSEIDSAIERLERGEISPDEAKGIARAARARVTRIRHIRDSLKRVQGQIPADQRKEPDPTPNV